MRLRLSICRPLHGALLQLADSLPAEAGTPLNIAAIEPNIAKHGSRQRLQAFHSSSGVEVRVKLLSASAFGLLVLQRSLNQNRTKVNPPNV